MSEIISKEVLDIFKELAKPLPKEAIQRTTKEQTKKAYDTTGYNYQYLVNRFNEVLGNAWGYTNKIIMQIEGKYSNGTPYFDLTIETSIWILSPAVTRSMVGGHRSSVYADAHKGASTNSFKKTAAMFGVGREAFEGSLDDDTFLEEEVDKKKDKLKTEKIPEKKDDNKSEPLPKTEPFVDPLGGTGKTYLTFGELIKKMATSKNKYELTARCKKYKPDYNELDQEHQKFVIIERDKRILWLTKGEGIYEDEATRGIDKDRGNEGGK